MELKKDILLRGEHWANTFESLDNIFVHDDAK